MRRPNSATIVAMKTDQDRVQKVIQTLKRQYPNTKYYLNFNTPLELLIAAILSAQCRDEVVNAATPKLFEKYKSAADYANAPREELISHISDITFAGNKAKHIQAACKILVEQYDAKVPDRLEELTKLPGIGRKTANAILINAFNKVVGIVVDTHVIRLSQRLGFTKQKDPDKIEQDLMKLVPKEDWKVITWLMKDHGRAVCTAKKAYCERCVISELCPKLGV